MGQFTADLSKFCKTTAPEKMAAVVQGTLMEIGTRLVERSPVGDPTLWASKAPPGYAGGRFRANWQYGFGAAPSGALDGIDRSGDGVKSKIATGVLSSPVAGVHYIVNNLPYAQVLENGHSTQAPHGMVGLTMLEVPGIIAELQK